MIYVFYDAGSFVLSNNRCLKKDVKTQNQTLFDVITFYEIKQNYV